MIQIGSRFLQILFSADSISETYMPNFDFIDRVKKVPANIPADFSDFPYQSKMPMYARSTATKAVKNNIRVTEEIADPNIVPKVCLHTNIITCQCIKLTAENHQEVSLF